MNSAKSTSELEEVLGRTHPEQIGAYLEEYDESMLKSEHPFADYMHERLREQGLKQQDVFLAADISERYGYKLLSEEKRTRQRDVILRLCYASRLTLDQAQHALKLYGMPQLYARLPRDAALMIAFNERMGDIIDVNEFLKQSGLETLRTCGAQE